MTDLKILLSAAEKKALSAIALVEASLNRIESFDVNANYTALELEPFDALSDRFIRAVEVCIKYFRTLERYKEASMSETYRDLLNRMEKYQLISSVSLWVQMRDIRNRMVHDYLPEQLEQMYGLLTGEYGQELLTIQQKLKKL